MADESTITDPDGRETKRVGASGQIYLDKDLEGDLVTVVWRVEESGDEQSDSDTQS